jgi:ubiquitin-protein ligase
MTDNLFEPIPEPAIYNMTEECLHLLSADYPIPDPAWDYADIWKQVVTMQRSTTALAELLQQTENATPESDRLVNLYLTAIRDNVNTALGDNATRH